jgi:transposase
MPALKQDYEQRLYFEDEMRAGTRTESKRRWTECGHRPVCKVKLGYEFCYLYAAIAPENGHLLALILPEMTKECFELFMDFFKEQTRKLYGEVPVLLLADKAGSHQPDVVNKRGIAWEPLPTACPELNPVERFFEELRKELSNIVFEDIEQVEDCLSAMLIKYWQNPQTIIQLCNYPYLRPT